MHWDAGLYDSDHSYVQQYGGDLLPILNPKEGELILDLGCGTGDLSIKIAAAGAHVIGIDSSPEMINQARMKYPELTFEQMDARNFTLTSEVDGVLSNAVLHWIPEKDEVIRSLYRNLKPGGRIVLEFGGKGNVQTMLNALGKILVKHGLVRIAQSQFWYFPSLVEYAEALERGGFRVAQAFDFERPTPLEGSDGIVNWFRMFGSNFFDSMPPAVINEVLEETRELLRPTLFHEGQWYADYRRLRFVAIREK